MPPEGLSRGARPPLFLSAASISSNSPRLIPWLAPRAVLEAETPPHLVPSVQADSPTVQDPYLRHAESRTHFDAASLQRIPPGRVVASGEPLPMLCFFGSFSVFLFFLQLTPKNTATSSLAAGAESRPCLSSGVMALGVQKAIGQKAGLDAPPLALPVSGRVLVLPRLKLEKK